MNKKSDLDCYLYYMWNVWCYDVCMQLFDEYRRDHIWSKWVRTCEECTSAGAPAVFYANLDENLRDLLRKTAIQHYNP